MKASVGSVTACSMHLISTDKGDSTHHLLDIWTQQRPHPDEQQGRKKGLLLFCQDASSGAMLPGVSNKQVSI